MKVYVSGGCKNGKTAFAERLALKIANGGRRFYVATMIPFDGEDRARVQKHLDERAGLGFETWEQGRDIGALTAALCPGATYLVDSVTALLTNEMFPSLHGMEPDPAGATRCEAGLSAFAAAAENAVFVSDYIYGDGIRYDAVTEAYRRALARTDRKMAALCDVVIELCAGRPVFHKGRELLE